MSEYSTFTKPALNYKSKFPEKYKIKRMLIVF